MTKLEELAAEYGAAWDAYWVANADADADAADAWAVVEHAYTAYKAELKKQEEKPDDH